MLTPNIISKTNNLFCNTAESVTFGGKKTTAGFELMLANLKSSAAAINEVSKSDIKPVTLKSDRSTAKKSINTTEVNQRTDTSKKLVNTDESKQKYEVSAEKSTSADKLKDETTDKADDKLIDNNELERIVSLVSVVSEIIMDKLELSAEAFNELLEDQNMTALDLLEPANLQRFVLANSNEESVLALLTNESLTAVMKDLNNQINSMKEEAGILQDINELKDFIDSADIKAIMNSDQQKHASDVIQDNYSFNDTKNDINNQAEEVGFISDQSDVKSRLSDIKATDSDAALTSATDAIDGSQGSSENGASEKNGTNNQEMNPFQTFVDNMVRSVNNSSVGFNDSILQVSDLREIANQVIDKIKLSVKPDQTSLEMNLSPESLGKVNLTINSKEGVMTAHFVVENQISKEAIESQLSTLRETLDQQGIKVEAIEVTVSAYTFEQNNNTSDQDQSDTQKDNSSRHITIDEAMIMSDEITEDERAYVNNELSNNQINYIA